jgi:glutathione S-transferase
MHGGGPTDEARVAELVARLENVLAGYERILSKQPYLAGDKLTLADLFHLPYATFVEGLGYRSTYEKFPAFTKWLDGLKERESWKKITAK